MWYGCAVIHLPVLFVGPLSELIPLWLTALSAIYLGVVAHVLQLPLVVLLGLVGFALTGFFHEAGVRVRFDCESVLGLLVWMLSFIEAVLRFQLGPGPQTMP